VVYHRLGLLFGGGQLSLALIGTVIALFILWLLKRLEKHLPTRRSGTLHLKLLSPEQIPSPLPESDLRSLFHNAGYSISYWTTEYTGSSLNSLTCELIWTCKAAAEPSTPLAIREFASSTSISPHSSGRPEFLDESNTAPAPNPSTTPNIYT
jgi:uncharacterized membrane protein YhiD involved in acid resistance